MRAPVASPQQFEKNLLARFPRRISRVRAFEHLRYVELFQCEHFFTSMNLISEIVGDFPCVRGIYGRLEP